jgi:hypothetical protein
MLRTVMIAKVARIWMNRKQPLEPEFETFKEGLKLISSISKLWKWLKTSFKNQDVNLKHKRESESQN